MFSPVFILRQPESIGKKLLRVEPHRDTWPWGLPENDFSQSLSGWGAFEVVIVLAETYSVSFVHYDTSADGSRKCLVPNGILYWIQFMCVSACSGDLWLHSIQWKRYIARMFHPDFAAPSLGPRIQMNRKEIAWCVSKHTIRKSCWGRTAFCLFFHILWG